VPVSQTILTEITDDNEENPSALSTHRSPEKVNEEFIFGPKLGEGAYAVVRLATKKATGQTYAAKIYDKSKLVDDHRRQSVCREVMLM
jgi:serine/threonine protein kinase